MLRGPLGILLVCSAGCGIIGPTCEELRESGHVTTITGHAGAGEIVSHRVAYATEGSQNDGQFSWPGDTSADGPRLVVHATRAGCASFTLPAAGNTGECAVLATAGRFEAGLARNLVITHGRGNPPQLGTLAEYILWVVGDPDRPTSYSIRITWVRPVNC